MLEVSLLFCISIRLDAWVGEAKFKKNAAERKEEWAIGAASPPTPTLSVSSLVPRYHNFYAFLFPSPMVTDEERF